MKDIQEEWRPVIGYEGRYEVSNLGNVRRGDRFMTKTKNNGRENVSLTKNGVKINKQVHFLVASAFIPNPENHYCIIHLDRDRCNNNVNNLKWISYSEMTIFSRNLDMTRTLPTDKYKENISLYSSMHQYVRSKYDLKNECAFCGEKDSDYYHMALKKGRDYSYNVDDYLELCPLCHRQYDITDEERERARQRVKGRTMSDAFIKARDISNNKKGADNPNSIPIIQLSTTGEIIKEYVSLTSAAEELGTYASSIANCLKGRSKTCTGYKWKYKDDK